MKSLNGKLNSYFTHSMVADLIFIMINIFDKDRKASTISDIYSKEYMTSIEYKYRFMGEIIKSLPSRGHEMLEFLLINRNFNDIDEFEAFIENIGDEEFFYNLYGQYIDKELLREALRDDGALNQLYFENNYISTNYLALKSLFSNKNLFLQEFFSCLKNLCTEKFLKRYQDIISIIDSELYNIEKSLATMDPLELSQSIMGKTFKNRGPYETFIFVPSYFISIKAARYFGKDQILFYSLNHRELTKNDITRILKIISDDTRFEILELLSKTDSMIGKDLAQELNLSTPTISHHMDKLKEAGFINEERIKNSKFYSINFNSIDKFISSLSSKIKNNK